MMSSEQEHTLVHVRPVVVLTTGKTTTTGMLAVLAYTTVSSRDVTAAVYCQHIVFRNAAIDDLLLASFA